MPTTEETTEMRPHFGQLREAIQASLTPDLLSPKERASLNPGDHPTTGHCAIAAEAAMHLVRRYCPEYEIKPVCATYREDDTGLQFWHKDLHSEKDRCTHWWVICGSDDLGWICLDPTREQYESKGIVPPYAFGRGRGFQGRKCKTTGQQLPTKRAAIVINRALDYLAKRGH